mgnify:CR=1 FL=1
MKTIIFVRHAKSSWNHAGVKDFDRPLNDRGERDAPIMATRFKKLNMRLDLLVSSPAVRAASTARIFAGILGINPTTILFDEQLYLPEPEAFPEVLGRLPDPVQTVMVFSHNPGITSFVNRLSSTRVDDMPTCSMFAVTSDIDSWADFSTDTNRFLFFDYPKNPKFAER